MCRALIGAARRTAQFLAVEEAARSEGGEVTLTFGYTYENAGTHGFLHIDFGEHTESVGLMKNFGLPKTKLVSGYTWIQGGITSYTGFANVRNRFDSSVSLGAIVHLNHHNSV
jgi:hypothetical protein